MKYRVAKFPCLSRLVIVAIVAALSTGCGRAQETTGFSAVNSGVYRLDQDHSYIVFSYNHLGFSRPRLQFRDFDATLTLNVENPDASRLEVTIDAASIDSNVEAFNGHLKGAQLFDVEKFGEIKFSSLSSIQASDVEGEVTGILTIRDQAQPVKLRVTLNKAAKHPRSRNDTLGFSATATVKRSEWGLDLAIPSVGDDVDIVIEAEFEKLQ